MLLRFIRPSKFKEFNCLLCPDFAAAKALGTKNSFANNLDSQL